MAGRRHARGARPVAPAAARAPAQARGGVERITAAEYRAAASPPKRTKYNATRAVGPDGEAYDSLGEQAHHAMLKIRARMGEIRDLRRQTAFPLTANGRPVTISRTAARPEGRQVVYRSDFDYVEVATGTLVVEDWKGFDTRESRLKRAILETMGVRVVLVGPAAARGL